MFRIRALVILSVLLGLRSAQGDTLPVASKAIPNLTLVAGDTSTTVNLADYFAISGVTGTIVQFDTVKGKFNAELLANDAPNTVANFLGYVGRGDYSNSLIHRSVPGFVIQGGGFALSGTTIDPVTEQPAIKNEFKLSNVRGTIAMAKLSSGPDTATSQWFVNLADNSAGTAKLDTTNGGYTVFARVLGSGMSVVDAIAAVPVYDASAQLGADFSEMPLLNNQLTSDNLVLVKSIRSVPVSPDIATDGVLTFSGSNSNGSAVAANIAGSALVLKPASAGSSSITIRATDTNGNFVDSTFTVTVVATPLITTQPVAVKSLQPGDNFTLAIAATGSPAVQWQRNGGNLSGATGAAINFTDFQPASSGLFTAVATSGGASTTSKPAIIGSGSLAKVAGDGEVVNSDVLHPNGNIFDQVLVTGTGESITADADQVTRTSFIDLEDNIVQVEYSGPGTLSLILDESSGPAAPVNYNQPDVAYMKGHASIVITGATAASNLAVFTVGRATANDNSGHYNILLPATTPGAGGANDPATNGSPLFIGHESTSYDGFANIGFIAISSIDGKFGKLGAANAHFYHVKGFTGLYAPGVAFQGPVYIGDIHAFDAARPVLIIGSAAGDTRITGGNLVQPNNQPVVVSGLTQLKFTDGSDSGGHILSAQVNHATLLQNDLNVTSQIVVNPQ
jgi:cyclophilin family peptidyl-prolyl cis-trans isomerase